MPSVISEKSRKRNAEWHKENRERLAPIRAARIKNNPERVAMIARNSALKAVYGITLDDYNKLFEKQGGQCAICSKTQERTLHVDHCHSSGRVRGLLCQKCNMAIGLLHDSVDLLKKAVKYLNKKGRVL